MSDDQGGERPDRQAYLNEQIARQQRGEPVDLDWVRNELMRVRQEQEARLATSRRRLWWLVAGLAVLVVAMMLARR